MGWAVLLAAIVACGAVTAFARRLRPNALPAPWFGSMRAGLAPASTGCFVAILEVDRFATLRRDIGFRLANRVLGHVAGRVLDGLPECEIGRVGRTSVEFAFSAPDPDAARAALDRLAGTLSERIVIEGVTFDLSVLIGAARAAAGATREEVLDQAAAALATARERREPLRFADEDAGDDHEVDDLRLMRDLRCAVERDELSLHYQPKLRSRTGAIDSAEALLRWPGGAEGGVSIDRVIRLAESTGAIRDLTEWVVDRAVADQARLAAAGHDLTVYINVSGVLLPDANFARALLIKLAGARGRIGLEVTETAVIQDPEGALANLRKLAGAGIRIAIDDYGSGLSSLSYLKRLPANELKIDQMFVSGLIDSHRDPLLVRSSIDLAHALEMEVTAEGVEDPLALQLLRVMGCDLVQGYLISPPLAIEAFERFLAGFNPEDRLAPPKLIVEGAG